MVHPAAGDRDRLSLPGRAGRTVRERLLHQLHRHGRGLAPPSHRGLRRLERRHAHRRPGPQLPGAAARLARRVPGRPRRAGGAPGIDRRVPPPAVAMGHRQLPGRIQAAGAGHQKPVPRRGQVPGGSAPAVLRRRAVDARAARLLPVACAVGDPVHVPVAARGCRHLDQPSWRFAVGWVHGRTNAAGPTVVVRGPRAPVPGRRRRDELHRADGARARDPQRWRVCQDTQVRDRPPRTGMA